MKKNRRNLFVAMLSLALVCVIGIGATLAYFTDETEIKTNVFTTGKVDIGLTDTTNGPDEDDTWTAYEGEDGVEYGHVMPGDVLSKIVKVNVESGSENCYVAVRVSVRPDDKIDVDLSAILDSIQDQARANNWAYNRQGDAMTVYYPTELVGGDEVTLFTEVEVPTTWGNEYADATFYVDVQAAAVQSAHLGATGTADEETIAQLDALLNQR